MKYSLLGLIILISAFLFSYKTSTAPLIGVDEPIYAEITREMLETGDYIIPQLNYQKLFNEPIFFYWQELLSFKVFGINEFAARLPSLIFGLGMIFLAFLFGNIQNYGLISAVMMATSLQIFLFSKLSVPEMTSSFFISASLVFFYLGYHQRAKLKRKFAFKKKKSSAWFSSSLAMTGIVFLTKGPVFFLIPIIIIISFLWFQKDLEEFIRDTWKHLLAGLIFITLINLPWYLSAHLITDGQFTKSFFITNGLNIFTNINSNHNFNWWYFLPTIIIGLFPWSFFLLPSFYNTFSTNEPRSKAAEEGFDHINLFLNIWIVTFSLFFLFVDNKNLGYVLPIYLPLINLLANWWTNKFKVIRTSPLKNLDLLLVIASITISIVIFLYLSLTSLRIYLEEIEPKAFFLPILLISFIFISFTLISMTAALKKPKIAFSFLAISTLISMTIANHFIYPVYADYMDDGIKNYLKELPRSSKLVSYKRKRAAFSFYSERRVPELNNREILDYINKGTEDSSINRYIISMEEDFMDLKKFYIENLPESNFPLEKIKEGKRYIVAKITSSQEYIEDPLQFEDIKIDSHNPVVSLDKF